VATEKDHFQTNSTPWYKQTMVQRDVLLSLPSFLFVFNVSEHWPDVFISLSVFLDLLLLNILTLYKTIFYKLKKQS
jgi:hypothetical protein